MFRHWPDSALILVYYTCSFNSACYSSWTGIQAKPVLIHVMARFVRWWGLVKRKHDALVNRVVNFDLPTQVRIFCQNWHTVLAPDFSVGAFKQALSQRITRSSKWRNGERSFLWRESFFRKKCVGKLQLFALWANLSYYLEPSGCPLHSKSFRGSMPCSCRLGEFVAIFLMWISYRKLWRIKVTTLFGIL